MSPKRSCVIIGAGIAGLASAIRLRANGYDVKIYEANEYAGGKIREWKTENFRFDMGPSVLTQPHLIDELFELHNKNPRDYFELTKLQQPFRYFFEDGLVLNSYADLEKFESEIETKTKDSKKSFKKYLRDVETKYNITNSVFIENSIHRTKDFLKKDIASGIFNFRKIHAFQSMDSLNRKFFKDPHLIELFNYYATYVGSNPFTAPGTLNVIQHLEINQGLYMPKKGIYSIIQALVKLTEEIGIEINLNTRVDKIIVKNKKAEGIIAEDTEIKADLVISNMDIYHSYRRLLKEQKAPERILNQEKSGSVIAFYWGINREYDQMSLHNMLFSGNQQKEYKYLFDNKSIYRDPSLYIYISSKHVKEDACEGMENWFVLVTAPNNSGQDWKLLKQEARSNAIKKINRILDTDIEPHIIEENSIDPLIIEDKYASAFGSVYGNSSNGMFSAFMRHANFSKKIDNLYFVGGSVHPGAGIPMCLNSAKIAEKIISDKN